MTTNLLTPNQTAELIHVEPETLAVWRSLGRYNLKFIKIGRKVLYDEADVHAFIEERKRTQTA